MRHATAYVLASFLFVAPASAGEQDPMQEFEDAAKGAASRIVEALRGLLMAVPQYEGPEILENGDIIIRRKPRPEADENGPPPRVNKTRAETIL